MGAGKPNLFRNIRKGEIAPTWQPYLEDITFQALILRELFPQAQIIGERLMPDISLTTSIDKLYSLFELKQLALDETGYPRASVTFTGDVNQLRRDHFLTRLTVDAEVADLLPTVASAAETFVNSLQLLTKIFTPISLNCRDCEYQVAKDEKQNSFRECEGALGDQLIAQGKESLAGIPESASVKCEAISAQI